MAQGGKDWFFITADYTFGYTLEEQTSQVVKAAGGRVLGSARHPIGTADFSSYLLKAQASGAKVIALANGGTDTISSIKQAGEFGLTGPGKAVLAGLTIFITDIHGLGLEAAQGMLLTTSFYWDRDEKSREWSRKFFAVTGKMPTMVHAGVYSGVHHYLEAVRAAGTDDGPTVLSRQSRNQKGCSIPARSHDGRGSLVERYDDCIAGATPPPSPRYQSVMT